MSTIKDKYETLTGDTENSDVILQSVAKEQIDTLNFEVARHLVAMEVAEAVQDTDRKMKLTESLTQLKSHLVSLNSIYQAQE